jgi:hypothetical protein
VDAFIDQLSSDQAAKVAKNTMILLSGMGSDMRGRGEIILLNTET